MDVIQGTYSTTDPDDQASHGSLQPGGQAIVIVCKTTMREPPQASASEISERARKHLKLHHTSVNGHESFLHLFPYTDAASIPRDTETVAIVFDLTAQSLFEFVETPPSNAGLKDGYSLIMFLNNRIWDNVADIQATRPNVRITLSSGPKCVDLKSFADAVEQLIDGGQVRAFVSAMGDMQRSKFWCRLIGSDVSSGSDEENYTYAKASIFDFDLAQLPRRTIGEHSQRDI